MLEEDLIDDSVIIDTDEIDTDPEMDCEQDNIIYLD